MSDAADNWYRVANADDVPSPALLVYSDRIEANIQRMIAIAGGPERLRPHVKTHKLPEIVRMQRAAGIDKFKCATIAEVEMTAGCGAVEVLLAYQPVGPNVERLMELIAKFSATRFATIADNTATARALSRSAHARGVELDVFLDLDVGMHRTGIAPGSEALELYRLISTLPGLTSAGLHAYDGHIHESDSVKRARATRDATQLVASFRARLEAAGLSVPRVVVGGSPTFPQHAQNLDLECSPGTCLLWDAGYGGAFADFGFLTAAVLLTRVISKPAASRLCLDLGHKAVASENPPPRVRLFDLPNAVHVMHSEEHLVIETPHAAEFAVGDVLYGIPHHICPTVALHASVIVVRNARADAEWKVVARDRMLTI